jgi:hypothetical protein
MRMIRHGQALSDTRLASRHAPEKSTTISLATACNGRQIPTPRTRNSAYAHASQLGARPALIAFRSCLADEWNDQKTVSPAK